MAAAASGDWYSSARLWHGGPPPAGLCNFSGGLVAQNTHFNKLSQ
jgi:hypothetical protein